MNTFCSVCINTYKRQNLLKKLLTSLVNQKINESAKLEIIVVDNDPEMSAKKCVIDFQSKSEIEIKYFVQPIKNISITRNKAVKNSGGEYILFIDDDEIADEYWVVNLLKTIKKYDADGAFGRVVPYYDANIPDWIKEGKYFEKISPPSGQPAKFMRTSNCIIKSELLNSVPGPFDERYGITGGEDSHLFGLLKLKGAKFITCYDAVVLDFIPFERAKLSYLIKKAFQTGNTATRRMIEFAENKLQKKLYLVTRASVFTFISLLMMIITIYYRKWFVNWLLKLTGNIGHIAAVLGYNFNAYK